MQLGFIGLGKMGGNMVHRIHRDSDHECVAFDFNEDAVSEAEGNGATGASSLEDLVSKLEALEVYRKYERDGNQELFRELISEDTQHAERLLEALKKALK